MNEIVLCSDEAFAVPLTVTLRSLMESMSDPSAFHVTVLSLGVSSQVTEKIESSVPDLRLDFLPLADVLDPRLAPMGHLSMASYGRLYAASILGSSCRRLLYLDADLLVLDDVAELFRYDLGDAPVAAVQDQLVPLVSFPLGLRLWRELEMQPSTRYFNAGVLVIDTARWHETRLEARVVDFCDRFRGSIRLADQDGLNGVLAGNFARLPCWWNQQSTLRGDEHLGYGFFDEAEVDRAVNSPSIVHFTAGEFKKPWQRGVTVDPERERWQDVLSRTSFASFQPPVPSTRQRLRYLRKQVGGLVGRPR
jgi:lipopolysaccharide biosynthesis glycosyltransferase